LDKFTKPECPKKSGYLIPVLFIGLLKHWETKGSAEVAPKQLHAYQYCVWAAKLESLPFHVPLRHAFNSLAAQRLPASLSATVRSVRAAFDFIYGEGRDPELEFTAFA
jgi:hypothetical protein